MLAVFCLLDDKGVIHIPKIQPGWIVCCAHGLGFKLLLEQVSYNGTDGETDSCTMDLFIILTLEEEMGIFQVELQ